MRSYLKKIIYVVGAILLIGWQLATAPSASAQNATVQDDVAPPTPKHRSPAPANEPDRDATTAKTVAAAAEADEATDATESTTDSAVGDTTTQTQANQYVRIQRDEAGEPVSLQTATVRFAGKPGSVHEDQTVDLVGVVHVGQAEYYEAIKKQLSGYDKVLYELVAPDGTRIRPEDLKQRRSLLSSMQTGMRDMLHLEYQLEKIDYMAENFRHADMSPDEFVEDLERRGDSVWKMLGRMMGAGMATQSQGGDVGMIMALFSKDRPMMMKRAMASQLIDIEIVTAGVNDANGENTLIQGRNRKAFQILKEELDAGAKTVAVFYGAGHLSDMAERLENEFNMEPTQTTWLDAWDLTKN